MVNTLTLPVAGFMAVNILHQNERHGREISERERERERERRWGWQDNELKLHEPEVRVSLKRGSVAPLHKAKRSINILTKDNTHNGSRTGDIWEISND